MSIAETVLPEFDAEMGKTRQVLQSLRDDKLDWKADPKFNTIGWVGSHLVTIVSWAEGALNRDSWDIAPVGGEPYRSPVLTTRQAILDQFDANFAAARKALIATSDEAFQTDWSLLSGGQPLFTMPRTAIIRNLVLNHSIHHRAILCMYLRMNDIAVPGMYGPSGDGPSQGT